MSDSPNDPPSPVPTKARKPRKPAARKRKPAAKVAQVSQAGATADQGAGAPAAPPAKAASEPARIVLMQVPMPVRWRDLDAFNHVNNSQYLSYLEEARLQWMMSIPGRCLDEEVAPVVAAAQLNYRRPIEWPNQVVVELFVERVGTTSVTIGHRIMAASDSNTMYCDGHVVLVWIDRTRGAPALLPAAVREACTAT